MNRLLSAAVLLLGCACAAPDPAPPAEPAPKLRVVVLEFENHAQYGKTDFGTQAADLATSELLRAGRFTVLESAAIRRVLDEQKTGGAGVPDRVRAAKVLGADVVVTGRVVQIGFRMESVQGEDSMTKSLIAECELHVKALRVDTGELIHSKSARGLAKISTTGAMGFPPTLARESLQDAVTSAVVELVESLAPAK